MGTVVLFHGLDGHTLRQDNLFTALKLLCTSFLTEPLGGKEPSTAAHTPLFKDSLSQQNPDPQKMQQLGTVAFLWHGESRENGPSYL